MFVKGSIPGSKNSFVLIKKNSKKINKSTTLEKISKQQTDTSKLSIKSKEKVKTPEKKEAAEKKVEKKEIKK